MTDLDYECSCDKYEWDYEECPFCGMEFNYCPACEGICCYDEE